MIVNYQWLERATLVTEYRACVEHYAALAAMNLDFAQRAKPIELTKAARLNCEAIRARLTEHKNAKPEA